MEFYRPVFFLPAARVSEAGKILDARVDFEAHCIFRAPYGIGTTIFEN
jgi:hypothetical protein